MKRHKNLCKTAVAWALTGGVVVSIAAMELGKNKEKEIGLYNGIGFSQKSDIIYMTENNPGGTKTKIALTDKSGNGITDSEDIGSSVDIKIQLNGFTDEQDEIYRSVKQLIEILNERNEEKVDYSSFKHLTNHTFDVVRIEDNRRLVDPNDRDHPLYCTINIYYNDKLIYEEEHQYVALDKDGNKVFLKHVSSLESLERQGIDITKAEEVPIKRKLYVSTIKK